MDVGSEKALARAALRFHEHYGGDVGRTTLRTRTLDAAQEAETSLDVRLQEAPRGYGHAITQPGVDPMLLELDGCEMRPGVFMTAAEAGGRIGTRRSGFAWSMGAMCAPGWRGPWTRPNAWGSVAWIRLTRAGWPVPRA